MNWLINHKKIYLVATLFLTLASPLQALTQAEWNDLQTKWSNFQIWFSNLGVSVPELSNTPAPIVINANGKSMTLDIPELINGEWIFSLPNLQMSDLDKLFNTDINTNGLIALNNETNAIWQDLNTTIKLKAQNTSNYFSDTKLIFDKQTLNFKSLVLSLDINTQILASFLPPEISDILSDGKKINLKLNKLTQQKFDFQEINLSLFNTHLPRGIINVLIIIIFIPNTSNSCKLGSITRKSSGANIAGNN